MWHDQAVVDAMHLIIEAAKQSAKRDHDRQEAFSAFTHVVTQMKDFLMSLQPEVQALVDAVAANTAASADAAVQLVSLEGKVDALNASVADLSAKLAAGSAPIDAEDLAAIVKATGDVSNAVAAVKAAVPATVAAPVVAAVAEAPPAGAI